MGRQVEKKTLDQYNEHYSIPGLVRELLGNSMTGENWGAGDRSRREVLRARAYSAQKSYEDYLRTHPDLVPYIKMVLTFIKEPKSSDGDVYWVPYKFARVVRLAEMLKRSGDKLEQIGNEIAEAVKKTRDEIAELNEAKKDDRVIRITVKGQPRLPSGKRNEIVTTGGRGIQEGDVVTELNGERFGRRPDGSRYKLKR